LEPVTDMAETLVVETNPVRSNSRSELKTIGYYRQILVAELPQHIFLPHPLRLVSFFVLGCLILGSFAAIALLPLAWPVKLLLGIVLGFCNGGLGFVAHEILHGSVVKNSKLQDFLGFFGPAYFIISILFKALSSLKLTPTQNLQLFKSWFPALCGGSAGGPWVPFSPVFSLWPFTVIKAAAKCFTPHLEFAF